MQAVQVHLDDGLVAEARQYAGQVSSTDELVELALREFIQHHQQIKDLRELKGKIQFAEDYDYKAMRTGL